MKIIVDSNEARCGLAQLLARHWDHVCTRRLWAGDVAVGERVLVERKTVEDFVASIADRRLFSQALRISRADRPLLIVEGDPRVLAERIPPDSLRGVRLALVIGYRIPILGTRDLAGTATCIRHLAAQEARRLNRRRRREGAERASQRARRRRIPREPSPATLALLESLPGVGKERARLIAEQSGPLSEVCRLGVRGLLTVRGIGPDTAARIADALNEGCRARPY